MALTSSCRDSKICDQYIQQILTTLSPLESALQESRDDMVGSEQERAALDRAYVEQRRLTQTLTFLEEQMVPPGYVTPVPTEYQDLPQLQGRATVEMTFQKESNAPFNVQGVNYPTAKLVMVIDGYVGTLILFFCLNWFVIMCKYIQKVDKLKSHQHHHYHYHYSFP